MKMWLLGLLVSSLLGWGCERELGGEVRLKLIRDKLPDIYRAEGDPTEVVYVSGEELGALLASKLLEESGEFNRTPNAEEMADILDVLEALRAYHKLDPAEVERVRAAKRALKGGFESGAAMKIR